MMKFTMNAKELKAMMEKRIGSTYDKEKSNTKHLKKLYIQVEEVERAG